MFALDIGCGENPGPALRLAGQGYIVAAVENNPHVLREYRRRLLDGGGRDDASRITPIIADARFLPFKDSSFDLIISYYAFDWISILGDAEDLELASREITRSLKEGCTLIAHEYWDQGRVSREKLLRSVGLAVEVVEDDEIILIARKVGEVGDRMELSRGRKENELIHIYRR